MEIKYSILKKRPLAEFYYPRSVDPHPVRREVVLIKTRATDDGDRVITGYEIRNGRNSVSLEEAPVKSYRMSRIPRYGDYWRLRRLGKPEEKIAFRRKSMNVEESA